MRLLSYFFLRSVYQSSSLYNKNIEVRKIHKRYELLVNGIQQTGVYTEKLWKKGVQLWSASHSFIPKDILVFGVGGGTLFHIFHKLYPQSHVTGVDIDEEIIRIGKKYFGLESLNNVSLICQDARLFANNKKNIGYFDLVVLDIYIGNNVPEFVTTRKFLVAINELLRKNGSLVINYFSFHDQREKSNSLKVILSDIFHHVYMVRVLNNVLFVLK